MNLPADVALSGLLSTSCTRPRAAPWAIVCCPFRAIRTTFGAFMIEGTGVRVEACLSIALPLITLVPLLSFCCSANAAQTITAMNLDGTAQSGELRAWSSERVTLAASGSEQTLDVSELLTLRWSPAPNAEAAALKTPAAELVDETTLPIEEFTAAQGKAAITLRRAGDIDSKVITVPAKAVAAVRLKPLDGDLAAQWDEVRSDRFASDVLVVLKRDGKSLDYIEGVLGGVTANNVEFKIDGESLEVDRTKVAGVVYFRGGRAEKAGTTDPQCVLHGRDGLYANAKQVALESGMLKVTTIGGIQFTWPLEDIYLADFSAGKLAFLSDLEPASEQWMPLIGLPASAKLANDFGKPRRDQSAYGGPLTLRMAGDHAAGDTDHKQTFNKGLAIRSRTEIVYRLPRGFRRFLAVAGIEPVTSPRGDVFLSIEGDGRRLLETQVAGDQPPHEIELDIEDVKRLTIVVDYGQNLDTGDWLNLCNARLVK